MQEQISKFKTRGPYIITVAGIEEDRDRKVWDNSVSWHNRHRGIWKWWNSVFHPAYADIMKTSRVYTRVTGCKVAYMKKGQQNRPRFSHDWLRLRGSRTDSGNGSGMVGSHSWGEYSSNNALLALWLEVVDKVYEAKWYILLFRNDIAGWCLWYRSWCCWWLSQVLV